MKKAVLTISALLVAGHLFAEEKGMGYGLKMRAQAGLETVDGMRNGFGFGAFATLPLGPGAIGFELGYQTWNGKQYRQDIGANPFNLVDGRYVAQAPAPVNPLASVDSRKNYAEGLSARLSYEMKFSESWGWQAGVAVAQMKGHAESITTFGSTGAYGSWAMRYDKSALSVSPYAGVHYDLGEKGLLEINVLMASIKRPTVEPGYNATATGVNRVTPVLGEKTVNKPKIEISYGFQF